jgi:hypothetical protein
VALFLLATLILAACGSGDSPREVAENFLNSYGKKEYNRAKAYCNEEGDRVMEMMDDLDKMMPDSANKEKQFDVLSEKIEGNTATVEYRISGSNDAPDVLTLVKEEGKWMVSMNKESINTPLLSDQPATPSK